MTIELNKITVNKNKIIKAGVIGFPINHSLSPKIHNYFINQYSINGSYEAMEIDPHDFNNSINNIINENFAGFNVTIPFKEKIFTKCDYISYEAKIIKAVNTVVVDDNKKLHGFNSDAQGFIDNIYQKYPNFILDKKNAFIIGAGGACRAVIYGLINQGVNNIFITNRSELNVKNIIEDFCEFSKKNNCNIEFLLKSDFENELKNCDILINTSALGMVDQQSLIINLLSLKKSSLVYDIVYKPLITDLLLESLNRGNPIITGIGMLINQALFGFNKWFGILPSYDLNFEKTLTLNNN